MRILWFSNAPWCPTGYGVQTALVCNAMKQAGHDIGVLCNWGLEDGAIQWRGITVYPKPAGRAIVETIAEFIRRYRADVVISFLDAWCMTPAMMGDRWVPWYPIDREGTMTEIIRNPVQNSFWSLTMSRFGERMAHHAGVMSGYVPCALNKKDFFPVEKSEARRYLNLPSDAFVVGIVAANLAEPSRKALWQQIYAFSQFAKKHPEALLYLHTVSTNIKKGLNLEMIIDDLGIASQVVFCDQLAQLTTGFSSEYMRNTYSALDVLSAVSADEGFGVPIIEAQACGTFVIAGGWTAMPELVCNGIIIPKADADPYPGRAGGYQYLVHPAALADVLEKVFTADMGLREAGLEFAAQFDIEAVYAMHWQPVLEEIGERIKMEE